MTFNDGGHLMAICTVRALTWTDVPYRQSDWPPAYDLRHRMGVRRMGLIERKALYGELEQTRGHPLFVYVTSSRTNSTGQIGGDVVPEVLAQLKALPSDTKALDLVIVSNGGDPTVAWRVVSLIRERVSKFNVLVPQAAFSAATLIALGADQIYMHPHGNLGPVDPQIIGKHQGQGPAPQNVSFGAEDLEAFLDFARKRVGLSDQSQLLRVFELFCNDVGAIPIGVAARSSHLSLSMGEKLLKMHMTGEEQAQRAKTIAEVLNKNFFHHGHPVSRSEAKQIGLPVADNSSAVDELLWRIWCDLENELLSREPFSPLALLRANPDCAPLFGPVPMVIGPIGMQVQMQQVSIPGTAFETIQAVVESARTSSRHTTSGTIFATRQPDLQIRLNLVADRAGWLTLDPVPATASLVQPSSNPAESSTGQAVQPTSTPLMPTPIGNTMPAAPGGTP